MKIRILDNEDQHALETFLAPHAETSMFLRSNARLGGLQDHGRRYEGTYAGAFDGERLQGVVAHYWNGNLIPQAPVALVSRLASAAVAASGRPVRGAVGPADQVDEALLGFDLAHVALRTNRIEGLYSLSLEQLRNPASRSGLRARVVEQDDRDPLTAWFAAYEIETLGAEPGPDLTASSEQRFCPRMRVAARLRPASRQRACSLLGLQRHHAGHGANRRGLHATCIAGPGICPRYRRLLPRASEGGWGTNSDSVYRAEQ